MTETNQVSSGADQDRAGGQADSGLPPKTEGAESQDDRRPSYDSHRKLLSEKKRVAEENAKLREELEKHTVIQKQREEEELKANNEWQAAYERQKTENEKVVKENSSLKTKFTDSQKLDSVLSTIDGDIDSKYWAHIDLTNILVDPATGNVDEMSVTQEVERITKEYPEIIRRRSGNTGLPDTAPKGGNGGLTYEEWLQLPAKEMDARLQEVKRSHKA